MTAETVNYSLESVLKEIKDSIQSVDRKLDTLQQDVDQKLDNIEKGFDRKLETLQKNVTDVKIGLATLTEKAASMDNRLINVEGTQNNQIWTLITILSGSLIAVGFRAFFMVNNP
ncbi:MAG: hypothetical protein EWV53_16890 [Microcystis panniformis Mp_MB_F_20051200_S9]|uniref:DUF4164 family protein n=1 Tax=Microcystis panniformis Mp_MB_F_20051200_S9 TaxID=2486223 RepID=A0A552PQY7_9CHRO|nr:MAG: hypothetical protein EWV43_20910 [Microcystis panniformis Mp_MB_F_20080800_S26D]TRV52305.1 MAG: hypothetical protein EWV87_05075 [Microcystis panniformis Mp_GB_SS_20050300_S99]TRV52761.1 MAG: hypothetical protein EWV42_07385 [Microcystis panniformis Mp_GB_SS_20050300_S99D]TRV55667.1 MAG: hypothetical protein EWV69_19845 [Microcystis panniformis Mp_MB_F_20080800_S26]TRV59398.1 MAG: hypothetical protein EWV53_16890 [Microcystis panniformis Mp_MB_F_20051200_S9]TRV63625.1 MAG: hypothetical